MFEVKIFEDIGKAIKISENAKSALLRLGIQRVIDLLLYKPINYTVRNISPNLSALKHGEEIVTKVKVVEVLRPARRNGPTKISCSNETGGILLTFFKIYPYTLNFYKVGATVNISGRVEFFDNYPQISHPELINKQDSLNRYEARYGLTYGITNQQLRSYIAKVMDYASSIPEWLPPELIAQQNLPTLKNAISLIHFGGSDEDLKLANLRLKYDEALANQLGFKLIRSQVLKTKERSFAPDAELKARILQRFKYPLTDSQQNTINEIELDQQSKFQMMRIVQGDVGCGKTIVAFLSSINVLQRGCQAVFMAPTEVLATQHYGFINRMLEGEPYKVALLTSKTTTKDRAQIYKAIETGEIQYVIGTHSLLNEGLNFKDLAFIVIDEQHKFGVKQRTDIISKGNSPDVLIMSATPIPRTLSLTYFGDVAMSKITEIPKNRKKILTLVSSKSKLPDILNAVTARIERGEKVYWICPLIENKEDEQGPKAQSSNEDNKKLFADIQAKFAELHQHYGDKVCALYGKIPQDKKNEIMENFKSGVSPILVATTVIEVGVDVPDATLIVIENAEQFGLAQLHQLRGRVGRGELESVCILLKGERVSQIAHERLKTMRESTDGFYIAEKDLSLRGEGELLGDRQSGGQNFKHLDLGFDGDIIQYASNLAGKMETDQIKEGAAKILTQIYSKSNSDITL